MSDLSIGEVACRAGLATSAIRYYERVGLLDAAQRVSGQRRYDEDVFPRLRFIGVAQGAGFTLAEIRKLIAREGDLAGPMRELSERKLDEVRADIERGRQMESWLATARSCDCASPDECALFEHEAGVAALPMVPAGSCRRPQA